MSEPLYPDFVTLVTQMSGFASSVMVETRIKVPSRPEPNLHSPDHNVVLQGGCVNYHAQPVGPLHLVVVDYDYDS